MAYEPTFYVIENIIGYTGELHKNPTVYFRCSEQHLHGHITQAHKYRDNVGRETVSSTIIDDYVHAIKNIEVDGREVAIEGYFHVLTGEQLGDFKTGYHESRGKFTDITHANLRVIDMLARSIQRFSDLKPIYAKVLRNRRRD